MNIISQPDEAGRGGSLAVRNAHLVPFPPSLESDETPRLVQYWRIIRRGKWVVLGTILVALVIGVVLTLVATPQYVAVATLEISRESDNIAGVEGMTEQPTTIDQEFYETQYGLLRSRSLARKVAEQLNLAGDEGARQILGLDSGLTLFSDGNKPLSAAARERRLDEAERALLERVAVAPTFASRLVDLRFSSPDPAFSAKVANLWVKSFIESSLERRYGSASYARDFLETRLNQVRNTLEDAERKLVAYAAQQGIVNLNSDAGGAGDPSREQSLVANNLSLLNAELAEATSDRVRAQSRLQQSRQGESAESLANQALATLRQKRAEAAATYAQLMVEFEPEYPRARALQSQVDELDRAIAREESRVGGSLQQEYRSALEREQQLQSKVSGLKSDVLDLRRRSIQYNIYKRDVDTSRTLYEGLLQRYKEIGIAGGVGRNNISIVDQAKPPEQPSSPNPVLNLLIALLGGTVAGVALAIGLQQIDQALADPDEIQKRLGIPLLGAIARAEGDDPLSGLADRSSGLAEGYMSVRTSLEFSTPSGVPRTIVVTSAGPGEGKSTSSLALAIVLARLGSQVLLVDGDMRSPSVHRNLQMQNVNGLSSFLSGHAKIEEIIKPTHVEGLATITAGPLPPNAAELLAGASLGAFLASAAAMFDHVIIDAPPVLGLADAPLLGARAEATVFVIEARKTKARVAERSLLRLQAARGYVVGAILTKFEAKYAEAGYADEYTYSYGKSIATAA